MSGLELAPSIPSTSRLFFLPYSKPVHHKHDIQVPQCIPVKLHAPLPYMATVVTGMAPQEPTSTLKGNNLKPLRREPMRMDDNAYASLLQACTNLTQLNQIHARMLKNGLDQDMLLVTKLVSAYSTRGSMDYARLVFDNMHKRDVFLWNVMIREYAKNGSHKEALALYQEMRRAGIAPNKFTFPFVLTACAGLSELKEGKEVHDDIVRARFESDAYVGPALVRMYCKCGSTEDARHVFEKISKRNVILWNAMILGFAQNGQANEALNLFRQMLLADETPDAVTMISVLPACARLAALREGEWIHGYIIKFGLDSNVAVGTAVVDMYAKCGTIEIARQLFEKMSKRDLVLWNAMISGYVKNGYASGALKLFNQMQLAGMKADSFTIVSVLNACAHLGGLEQGKWIHDYIIRGGFKLDLFVGTALIDMYAKCGNLELASQVFNQMSKRDVVSWNAIIAGYGMHGHGEEALALFHLMKQTGLMPNHVTFTHILSACSHAGLVDEGWHYFDCMSQDYCITPRLDHYACMVDLLGRSGGLDEAHSFIKNMPVEPDTVVWGALLAGCRIHGNIELGEHVAEHLFDLEPENAGWYVLLSNIYAAYGRWNEVEKVRAMMRHGGLKKTPGCSFIEVNSKVNTFFVGDRSHPQSEKIYATLEILAGQMEEAGYVPHTNFVLHDVEEEVKEHLLYSHSEKLAIAFGLISTSPRIPIRIMKNLRVCGDCHNATKFISKVACREIIVRDANRFHHFKDGLCSCQDYW